MQLIKLKNVVRMKGKFIPAVLFFGLFYLILPYLYNLYGQDARDSGFKYFKNYNYKEYNHQQQNWGMVQAPDGIIYVANQGGILEYDGVTWRIIDVPNYYVLSIAIDKQGTIYIGGKNEMGYLAPDSKGKQQYTSLRPFLPGNQIKFGEVWKTYASEKGIYFHTSKLLFRWDSQKKVMKIWEPQKKFYYSFLCSGRFFIPQENIGLMEMVEDTLQPVLSGNIFITKKIFMIEPFQDGNILIGTDTEGFYRYSGTGISRFPTEVDDYLKKNFLYHGTRLSSGDYALATRRGGLVIMDPQGRLKYTWNKDSGLQDNFVYYVFEDREENLWLCLNKGISHIENTSPFSIYDDRSGLAGILLTVKRHNDDLYVGSTDGLFYLESANKFSPVNGITTQCWDLTSIDDALLAATSGGVFLVDNKNNCRPIIKDASFVLLPSQSQPGRIWCGTSNRLVILNSKNGQLQEERRYESINQEIRNIVEEKNGDLWLITNPGSVLKMAFRENSIQPTITWYETSHGLPGGRVYAAPAAGHVMFATEKGLFRFDEKKNTFIPDIIISKEFAGEPSSPNIFRIVEDMEKNIWIHSLSRNYQAIPTVNNSFKIYNTPFLRIPTIQVNAIYPEPGKKITWFASYDGLFRYDQTKKKNYESRFNTFIRCVSANGNIIFYGCKNKNSDASTKTLNSLTVIEYKDRNLIQFEFAAPFYEAETENQYRYFLENYEKEWSAWDKGTKKNYTNLEPGLYAFRVQARNVFEYPGIEDIFRFKILLPWYRTWWAILTFILTLSLLAYFVTGWWRSIRLKQEKQRLEYTIKERTKEIQAKNLQLKEQSDKLEEMDRIKSRFFANLSHEFRTPLTLIMGPIEQMLSGSRDSQQKQEFNIILRNAQRLLTLINQLLDLSRFDSGKMKLQASRQDIIPFLKSILSSFHLAAQKKQLTLEFHSEKENLFLYFDTLKMEEVMNNLLINAVRFTPPRGKITVSVIMEHARQPEKSTRPPGKNTSLEFINISVKDTGTGIPIEQLPHIFDRFYQAKGPGQEMLKGTGIGLSLVKENVTLHHGRINVHSQEEKGSEFVIRLPLGHEHLKADEIINAAEAPPLITKDNELQSLLVLTEDDSATNGEQERKEINPETKDTNNHEPAQEKPVILVVEDHVDVRKYICKSLRNDYEIYEAGDGKEGIEKAREMIPDLIVSDVMMPEIDGVELCRKLKTDIKTSHIPIILLTAKAAEENIIQGLETGADDYVTKPFKPKILQARIKNLIELRRQLQQKIQKQMLLQPAEIAVSSMDRQFIEEIQAVIEKNLDNPKFNVEDLSKKLYMNRATLYRKMMALTGEPPVEFIRSYRLKRAAQLLRDKFGTVSQVALEVGFDNPAYFAKCFKEKFQQLPSSYQAAEAT